MPVATVKVQSFKNLQQVVTTFDHSLVADEPPEAGDGLGPDPYELLLAALGTCTSMTLLLYARRKEWPLDGVYVELSHDRVHARDCEDCEENDDAMIELFRRYILVKGNLDQEQVERLGQIAQRCPVHRTLTSAAIKIVDELDAVPE
jgi:putative redox protein